MDESEDVVDKVVCVLANVRMPLELFRVVGFSTMLAILIKVLAGVRVVPLLKVDFESFSRVEQDGNPFTVSSTQAARILAIAVI